MRIYPKKEAVLLNENLLERPDLCAHIGVISVLWNKIDAEIGEMFANLLGVNASVGITLYLAVDSDSAKSSMIRAIAKKASDVDRAKIETLIQDYRAKSKNRNKVVHGIWAIPTGYKDELLWTDPRDFVRQIADLHHSVLTRIPAEYPRDKVILYLAADFEEIEQQAEAFFHEVRSVSLLMLRRYGIPSINAARLRKPQRQKPAARPGLRKTIPSGKRKQPL